MRTIAVLSRKGGTGKTTVSVQLAVAAHLSGRRTTIIDLDPQRSALDWRRERDVEGPTVLDGKAGGLFTSQLNARRSGTELLMLDTRASNDVESAEAARMADFCLLVVRPSFFDVQSIARTAELVTNLRKPAYFVVNQAPSRRNGEEPMLIREAAEMLRGFGVPLAPVGLRYRAAYQNAVRAGRAAQEIAPDSLAAFEVNTLWHYVKRELWPAEPQGESVDQLLFAAA